MSMHMGNMALMTSVSFGFEASRDGSLPYAFRSSLDQAGRS
jgi:hypothetical protein